MAWATATMLVVSFLLWKIFVIGDLKIMTSQCPVPQDCVTGMFPGIWVDPKPVDEIHVTKYRFGKETDQVAKSSMYDPRATEDREINPQALETLSSKLSTCLQSSSYFLFYGLSPQPAAEANVEEGNLEIESLCEAIPENAPDIVIEKDADSPTLPFNDQYDISSPHFIDMMQCYVETITGKEIDRIERITRGQSCNDAWRELKRVKLTAFDFYAAAVRQREPVKLLENIMYLPKARKPIPALEYGQLHEKDAVTSYVASKAGEGNTNPRVYEVGTIISKERPGYGARLDRKVCDPMASGMKTGSLEVKCPHSKRGLSLE